MDPYTYPIQLDGQGRVEVVALGYTESWVLHSQGDGGFTRELLDPALGAPVADLDHNGTTDGVAGTGYEDDPRVLAYRELDGGVTTVLPPGPAGSGPLLTGDFTGDGVRDLLMAFPPQGTEPNVQVYRNTGNRTYEAGATVEMGPLWSLTAADLNGDDALDLVGGTQGSAAGVDVWLSPGFARQSYSIEYNALTLCTGDFNGDGHVDVVGTTTGGLSYTQLLNDGTGALLPATNVWFAHLFPRTCQAADLNGDLMDDLVVAANGGFTVVATQLGSATGVNVAAEPFDVRLGVNVTGLEDLVGSPALDLVLVDPDEELLVVLPGHGDGTFEMPTFPAPVLATDVVAHALMDVTGDSVLDLVTGTSATVDVQPGEVGGFGAPLSTAVTYTVTELVPADLNGDLFMDAVALTVPSLNTVTLLGSATGLVVGADLGGGDVSAAAVGDANDDDHTDLAVFHNTAVQVGVRAGLAGGGFGAEELFSLPNNPVYNPVALAAADANADQVPDFTAVSPQGFDVAVLTLTRQADQWHADAQTLDIYANVVGVGDFNGDGRADVVTSQINAREVSLFQRLANGTFNQVGELAFPGGAPHQLAVTDVDGDAHADVAVMTRGGQLTVFLGNGAGVFGPGTTFLIPQQFGRFALQDVTGDSRPDLWVNQSNGVLSLHVAQSP